MSTRFLLLSKAVEVLLRQPAPVAPHIERNRSRVLPAGVRTAAVVRQGQAQADQAAGRVQSCAWVTALLVDCYGRASAGQAADEAADSVLQAVQQRLQQDPTLGQLAAGIALQGVEWDFDVDGEATACATATYYVRHATHAADLT